MSWNELDSGLIAVGLDAGTKDDIMESMGGRFVELGYCKPSYIQALKVLTEIRLCRPMLY